MPQYVQNSFDFAPAIGVEGQLARIGGECETDGFAASARKLVSVAVTAVNGFAYSLTVNGTVFTFTADGSATTAEIVAGLSAAVNAGSEPVHASGTDTPLLLEATRDPQPAADFDDLSAANRRLTGDFSLSLSANLVQTLLVDQGQEISAGVGVCKDERSTDAQVCRLPRQASDVTGFRFIGPVLNDLAHVAYPVGNKQTFHRNTMLPVLEEGDIYVMPEQAVQYGDPAFCRFAVGAGGSRLGAWRKDADSATAAQPSGRTYFKSDTAAGQLAVLHVER